MQEKTSVMLAEMRKLAVDFFPTYERQLERWDSGFLFPKISWVDFLIADWFETIRIAYPALLTDYPRLDEYRQRVHDLPELSAYIKNRKLSY